MSNENSKLKTIYIKIIVMRGYFGLGQLSAAEKSDILNQHKSVYNGYQTMQPQVSNTQPLTVYDFAGDKEGLVVNNKGEVKKYTNMGINEQVETNEVCDECGAMQMSEGECMECGYSGGEMEEGKKFPDLTGDGKVTYADILKGRGVKLKDSKTNKAIKKVNKLSTKHGMEEETGHLDDIYSVRDLNLKHGDFDYVEGGGNDYGTFEGMHKNLYKEDESDEFVNYDDNFEDPDNENDGFEDLNASEVTDGELEELDIADLIKGKKYRYNRPTDFEDMEYDDEYEYPGDSNMYGFKSGNKGYSMNRKGVEDSISHIDDELYEEDGNVDDMDVDSVEPAYDFESEGPGGVYPVKEYETMESAWANEELDEVDISGSQGIYGDMDPAYDFDSGGPGKGGPYQEFSYGTVHNDTDDEDMYDMDDEDMEDMDDEWEEIDEDLQEDFKTQKNKIMEMFNRFNKYN